MNEQVYILIIISLLLILIFIGIRNILSRDIVIFHGEEFLNASNVEVKDLNVIIKPEKKSSKVLIFNTFNYPKGLPEYAKYSSEITQKYADKYGYDYRQFNHKDNELPPYWLRVKDALDVLTSTDYDIIVYLDLDATFYDFDTPIEEILIPNYDVYIGADPANIISKGFNNIVNSGCFIVRNTEWSRKFFDIWLHNCIDNEGNLVGSCKKDWVKDGNGKWSCPSCKWAGLSYEQGSFGALYLMNILNAQDHVCIFNQKILSNTDPENRSFVLHLMGSSDSKRLGIFRNILTYISMRK